MQQDLMRSSKPFWIMLSGQQGEFSYRRVSARKTNSIVNALECEMKNVTYISSNIGKQK